MQDFYYPPYYCAKASGTFMAKGLGLTAFASVAG